MCDRTMCAGDAVTVGRFKPEGIDGYRAKTAPGAPLRTTRAEAIEDEHRWMDEPSTRYKAAKRIVTNAQFEMVEGVLLDIYTANAMVLVYEALNAPSQAKFDQIPLTKLADFCFSKVSVS